MAELDSDLVRHALGVARKHGFAEVELGAAGGRFEAKLSKSRPASSKPLAPAQVQTEEAPEFGQIRSTLVGYYRPTKTPLAVGERVQQGQVVAIVSALGIANEVESTLSGEVVEVLVEPDQPVEYGQALALVRPE